VESAAAPAPAPARARLAKALRNLPALVAALLLVGAVALAIFAPFVAPHAPDAVNLARRLLPPGAAGDPLGTDPLGRDVLSRVLFGARISLLVGGVTMLVAGLIGTCAGLLAGYFPGAVDDILMRLGDIVLSFPFLLLALIVVAALGPSVRNLIIVLVLRSWITYGRVVRSQVVEMREVEFVEAARALGAGHVRILLKHVLPRVAGVAVVVASFNMAEAIVYEASLSFLGAGVPPPTATWGGMLHDNLLYIATAWWTIVFPAAALTLVILALNVLGDWIRDALDPNLRL